MRRLTCITPAKHVVVVVTIHFAIGSVVATIRMLFVCMIIVMSHHRGHPHDLTTQGNIILTIIVFIVN